MPFLLVFSISQSESKGIIPPINPSATLKLKAIHVNLTLAGNDSARNEGNMLNCTQKNSMIMVIIKRFQNLSHPCSIERNSRIEVIITPDALDFKSLSVFSFFV